MREVLQLGSGRPGHCAALAISAILTLALLGGCGLSTEELAAVAYTPFVRDDWPISTPEEQGLDPKLVAQLYDNAAELETLYGLLVVKNGHLIAEDYFHSGGARQVSARQSIAKSYTSALVGIALGQGCLSSLNQKMIDFFSDYEDQIRASDPRKAEITIRDLLQMRSGYQNEQLSEAFLDALFFTENWHWVPHIADFPLAADPGAKFQYSEIAYHTLGVIVARACETDLMTLAQKHLFAPLGADLEHWSADADGYNFGNFEIYVTARDMAKFGLLYLNDGEYDGTQVIPASWVRDSLQRYSDRVNVSGWPPGLASRYGYFRDVGYGYGWWSAQVGDHRFSYAAGHGGQFIVLLDDLDMVIVTTADPLVDAPAGEGWDRESAIVEVVGKFIRSLPRE